MKKRGWRICVCLMALAMLLPVSVTSLATGKKPVITSQPKNVTVKVGETASFKVTASGKSLKYQWYYQTAKGTTWKAVSGTGGKTANYKVTAKKTQDGYRYKCVVKNGSGKVSSNTVTLKLIKDTVPKIKTQPKSLAAVPGMTAVFSVSASGGGLKYQWYYKKPGTAEWTAVKKASGKTAKHEVTVSLAHDGYKYKCVITNAAGKVTSEIVKLSVRNNVISEFESGGIVLKNGRETVSDHRARSAMYPLETLRITWTPDSRFKYVVIYYDSDYNVVGNSGLSRSSKVIRAEKVPGAAFFRILLRPLDSEHQFQKTFTLATKNNKFQSSKAVLKVVHDKAGSKGVKTLLKRADQFLKLPLETKNVLPFQKGDLPAGTKKTGVIYSSARTGNLFVSQCVSLDTYMTALKNPNSYIYTRRQTGPNSKTYYGAVCSSFISYVYDLGCVFTTRELGGVEGFELAKHQDAEHLEIGDMVLRPGKHVLMVYDITRDANGKLVSVYFAHQATPTTSVYGTTPSDAEKKFQDLGYRIYKFKNWDKLTYEESQWVSVGGEGKKDPSWNRYLGPRRGDKANWPLGEDVEIDILKKGSYTAAQLYHGDELLDETGIAGTDLLTYSDLDPGAYRVCLTDGEKKSSYCYFKVVSSEITVEDLGGGKAKISFHSDMGTPCWFAWCFTEGKDKKASALAASLTAEDIENGYVVSKYKTGDWFFRVEFRNRYGVFSSKLVRCTITE